jgi:hypothetical protein
VKAYGDISPLQVQSVRNFTGVDNRSLFNIDDTKSYLQNNMTADNFPMLKTRSNIAQLGSGTIAGRCLGLSAWKNSELNTIYNDGVWYKWNGTSWTSVTTGLSTSAYASFCNFQGNLSSINLLMANGVDAVKKYDGTSVSNLNNAPAGITYIDAHDNRVYGATGNTIYFSALRKPEDWTTLNDAGSVVVESNDGETITSIKSGLQKLTVFKTNSMYELFGTGPSNYRLVPVADNIGILNHRCSTVINGVMYFLGKNGMYRYTGGSRPDKSFCDPVQNIIDATANYASNTNYVSRSCVGDDGQSVYVLLNGYNTLLETNNVVLQYHTLFDVWTVYGTLTYPPTDFENMNGTLYAGCNFNVATWKSTGTSDSLSGSSQVITGVYVSKAFSGAYLGEKNRFLRLYITHDTDNGNTVTAYGSVSSTTTFTSGWTTLGTFTGTGGGVTTSRIMIPQSLTLQNGNFIQIKLSGNARFSVHQIGFEYLAKPLV